jgi:aromatic-amino-acid transaminase
MFQHLEPYAGDPILSLNDAFQKDPRKDKVNLSIGIYFDDEGRIPVLQCVRDAEAQMLAEHAAVKAGRIATLQTVGSSGGLRVGADFIKRWLPGSQMCMSDPSWDNHRAMFEGAGIAVHTYPYYDPATGGVRFDAMREAIAALPARSIVLLHACCHNPTGVDLSREQW